MSATKGRPLRDVDPDPPRGPRPFDVVELPQHSGPQLVVVREPVIVEQRVARPHQIGAHLAGTRPVCAPIPTSATDLMLPGFTRFCRCTAWNAAAHASATFIVSLTFCEDCRMVGVEIRYRGTAAPDGTHTALPTGRLPPNRSRIARCTRTWICGAQVSLDDGVDATVHPAPRIGGGHPRVDVRIEQGAPPNLYLGRVRERGTPGRHHLVVDIDQNDPQRTLDTHEFAPLVQLIQQDRSYSEALTTRLPSSAAPTRARR